MHHRFMQASPSALWMTEKPMNSNRHRQEKLASREHVQGQYMPIGERLSASFSWLRDMACPAQAMDWMPTCLKLTFIIVIGD